ncbi:MAG: HD domain-containing protein [Nanoarchaeota archaeon]
MIETLNDNKIWRVLELARNNMPNYKYHNIGHAIDVAQSACRLGKLEGVNENDRQLLIVAGLMHDYVYEYQPSGPHNLYLGLSSITPKSDNEERSAKAAESILPSLGYLSAEIKKISQMILATKVPQNPKNLLERIMCDADLDVLGRDDLFENKSEKYRQELGIDDKTSWYRLQTEFLSSRQYFTKSARKLREEGAKKNIAKFKKIIG